MSVRFALVSLVALAAPALAQDYRAGLGPMPLDDETKVFIAGRGFATARYVDRTLTIEGRFPWPAVVGNRRAHLPEPVCRRAGQTRCSTLR